MGGEIPIAKTFTGMLRSRFRNTIYGYLRSLWDTVLPVQLVGHQDFSDAERAAWHIFSYSVNQINQYASASISSRVDIAIEAINFMASHWNGTPEAHAVYLYTPVASYVPWGGAAPVVYWIPGVRPRIEFDLGHTFVTTGTQGPGFSPVSGWLHMATLSVGNNTGNSVLTFNPPFILPATMYLTAQVATPDKRLYVSWRYREIG